MSEKEDITITRKELEEKIRTFPNVSDQFLALAVFEGIGGPEYSEFYNLLPDQFVGNIARLGNRDITVSDLLVSRAKLSAREYSRFDKDHEFIGGFRSSDPSVIKDKQDIITSSKAENTRRIYKKLARLEENYGHTFGYIGLRNSGRISLLQNLMEKDGSHDISETFKLHRKEIEKRYGKLLREDRWIEENKDVILHR